MKVVILAGGFGTRIGKPGVRIPKPLVEVHGRPILIHIMESFANQGFNDFVVALGYQGHQVKDYLLKLLKADADLHLDFSAGVSRPISGISRDWNVSLVDTGESTMTGGRLKRLGNHVGERFFLTYGDGLSNVNLTDLLTHHEKTDSLLTITAVHPTSRYGEVKVDADGRVSDFTEKPEFTEDWISGGFMVVEPDVVQMVEGDETVFEAEIMPVVAARGKMAALKHEGFWHCMDTLRDKALLDQLAASGVYPWLDVKG